MIWNLTVVLTLSRGLAIAFHNCSVMAETPRMARQAVTIPAWPMWVFMLAMRIAMISALVGLRLTFGSDAAANFPC